MLTKFANEKYFLVQSFITATNTRVVDINNLDFFRGVCVDLTSFNFDFTCDII